MADLMASLALLTRDSEQPLCHGESAGVNFQSKPLLTFVDTPGCDMLCMNKAYNLAMGCLAGIRIMPLEPYESFNHFSIRLPTTITPSSLLLGDSLKNFSLINFFLYKSPLTRLQRPPFV